jgi:SAM-dependent methyltransferase
VTAEDPPFEDIYAAARDDLASIPWASLAPNPALQEWLDTQPGPQSAATSHAARALVVASGLGDDAEELARRGYRVTAFDISPTAIELCRSRFPASTVDYLVADLFDLPPAWTESYNLAVEIRTLQSLPLQLREQAAVAIARTLAPGGKLFVRAAARKPNEPLTSRPWPLTRDELDAFTQAGLIERQVREEPPRDERFPTFTAVYQRPPSTT